MNLYVELDQLDTDSAGLPGLGPHSDTETED